MESRLAQLGRSAAGRPGPVLRGASLAVVALAAAAVLWGGELSDGLRVNGSESDAATTYEIDSFPERLAATARVVWVADAGRIDDGARRAAIGAALERAWRLRGVEFVEAPYLPELVSRDGRAMISEIQYDPRKVDEGSVGALRRTLAGVPGVRVEIGGTLPEIAEDQGGGSELVGVAVALVVLLVAFGSVVAAGLPIVLAAASLGTGLALVLLLARFTDVSSLGPQLAATVGMGVGIDYALIIITRFRAEVAHGRDRLDAIAVTMDTAGRAVLFAGTVVVLSIAGIAVSGVELLTTMGVATSICVAAAMIAALVVLPAVLGALGPRLDAWPLGRSRLDADHLDRPSRWLRVSAAAMRRPVLSATAATLMLLLLAAPALRLDLAYTDAASAPRDTTARRAYDLIAAHFGPGYNASLEAIVDLTGGPAAQRDANSRRVADALAEVAGVAAMLPVEFGQGGEQSAIRFFPTTEPRDDRTKAVLDRARSATQRAIAGTGTRAWVSGGTAVRIDFDRRVADRLPWFVGIVLVGSVLLLLVLFRAPVVALKASVMNLLSIGGGYGAVVAAFQWGWAARVLGLDGPVPIDPYVPVFLFAILFGLSMDYEVFLLSAIRDGYRASGDNGAAIRTGIGRTARVITSAALVMIAVFAGLLFASDPLVKMFGVGLVTAIAVDVTVVRMVLLPALMKLLGRANWWPHVT